MAGLIQQQMPGGPAADAPQDKMALLGLPPADKQKPQAEEGEGDESNPAYIAAMKLAMQALYENGAAKEVAKTLRGTQDKVEALANTAYEMTSIVDERTDGQVPDELFALLAANILQEVADIAIAAQIDVKPADIAGALKTMILRYLGEQGVDTTQLQQAMDQVDPAQFDQVAAEEGATV
jgi:hypothetical protein